ncbi:MAG: aminotransferase [Gammaproteobacteria bacterium]|nr:aminotransferase [Gammaproteobacteria bacterium]
MMIKQFSPWPSYSVEEIDCVKDVLASNKVNYWTGDQCRKFEKEFAAWSDSEYAVSLANGTLALDIAIKALGIGDGDEVIVTSRSYIASITSIINAKATPVFVDVDPSTQNITPKNINAAINKNTKAIMCVHLAGWPCDMDEIKSIASDNDLFIIEDCAQAHGAKYRGKPVGSIGDIGCWSFCQDKIMTTGGEGGMVTTNNKSLWLKMWEYKDHGKSYEAVYNKKHPEGFRWIHESFGTNWRMTEMQGAIGRIQLNKMAEWTKTRNGNAKILTEKFSKFTEKDGIIRIPQLRNEEGFIHAFYKYYVFVQEKNLKNNWTRDRIISEISSKGAPCMHGSCSEVYLEKAFDNTNFRPDERLPVAKQLGETSIVFLVHPTLNKQEMYDIAEIATSVFDKAGVK